MRVHHVAAHAELVLVLFRAYVEVEAHVLAGCDASVAAEARKSLLSAVGEAQAVGIVAAGQDGELVAVVEVVGHDIAGIAVVGSIAGVDRAKPSVGHAGLDGEVDHGLVLAVIHSCESCQVALAVDDLQLVDHVGRDVLAGHGGVIGKEFLAVDEYLLDLFAIGGDLAVAAHLHAGQALEQVLNHGIGLGLVGVGVKLDGVLLDRDGGLHADDGCLLEHDGAGLESHHAHVDIATIVANGHTVRGLVIAHVAELDDISSGLDVLEVKHSVEVGRCSLDKCAVLLCLDQSDSGFHELGGVGGIDQYAIDDGSMQLRHHGHHHQGAQEQ